MMVIFMSYCIPCPSTFFGRRNLRAKSWPYSSCNSSEFRRLSTVYSLVPLNADQLGECHHSCNSSPITRINGRRELKYMMGVSLNSQTLPSRGRRHGQQLQTQEQVMLQNQQLQQQLHHNHHLRQQPHSSLVKQSSTSSSSSGDMSPPITSYHEKTVSLYRGHKGFGFVLRGAKSTALPLNSKNKPDPISLQYLDEIEEGGVAQNAGLEKGDFLLNVNGVDVRHAPHDQVVTLIRQSGKKVTMSVAKPIYLKLEPEEIELERQRKEKKRLEKKSKEVNGHSGEISGETNGSSSIEGHLENDSPLPPPPPLHSETSIMSGSTSMITIDTNGSGSMSRVSRINKQPPPAPPKRDPSTTLTSLPRSGTNSTSIGSSVPDAVSGNEHLNTQTDDESSLPPPPFLELLQEQSSDGGTNFKPTKNSVKTSQQIEKNKYNNECEKSSLPTTVSVESPANTSSASKTKTVISFPTVTQTASSSINGNNTSTEKVAGIRTRGTARRLSALELERFMSDPGKESSDKDSPGDEINNRTQTLKSGKKNKKPSSNNDFCNELKKTLSTGDIHQELQTLLEKEALVKGSLPRSQKSMTSSMIAETVTLKNGKIVPPIRSQPPMHAPPPLPSLDENGFPRPPSVVLKREPSPRDDSEYANFDEIKNIPESQRKSVMTESCMSSFKAPIPLPEANGQASISTSNGQENKTVEETKPNTAATKSILKPVKSVPSTATQPVSVYTRQPTMDVMDERKAMKEKKMTGKSPSVCSSNASTTKSESSVPFIPEPDYSTSEDEEAKLEGKSSKEVMSTFKTSQSSSQESNSSTAGNSLSSQNNKVQESIRVFERRSSLEKNESSAVSMTTSLNPSSISSGSTTSNVLATTGNDSCSSSGCSSEHNNLRMSRSLYEVESLSSEASEETQKEVLIGNTSQRMISSMNRRNSGQPLVVSEKIASLIAQTHPHVVYGSQDEKSENHSTLPSSLKQQGQQRSLEKRVSIADPPEQQHYHSAKTAPTTAKTWSEISSEIKVVKGQRESSRHSTSQANQVKTSCRPISAPTQKQLSRSTSLTRNPSGKVVSNEVDVMAELVPPPPQFAALPGQHKLQIQVRSDSLNQPGMEVIRVVNPATGQTHIVHKPSVKAPAPLPPMMAHLDGNRATPPKVSQENNYNTVNPQSAVARLGVSVNQSMNQSQYRMLTPQQQAHLNFLHQQKQQLSQQQQQQLNQQQFATLSRAYSATQQQQQQVNQQRMMTALQQQSNPMSKTTSQGSPHLPRAQFAVASNNMTTSNNPSQGNQSSQGYSQGQQLHFATLSRAGQKAVQQNSSQLTYSDLNRLSAQARLLRESQGTVDRQPQATQNVHLHLTQAQLQAMSPQQRQALIQRIQAQQQSQGVHYHVHQNGSQDVQSKTLPHSKSNMSHHHTISFPRKAMVNWSDTDVSDWLTSIGMSDHRPVFSCLNGVKLLSLDNSHLLTIGVKNPQHRLYLLDKIKQYLSYQQQHPPTTGQ